MVKFVIVDDTTNHNHDISSVSLAMIPDVDILQTG